MPQVLALVPGLAPLPWQVSHESQDGMRICASLPRGCLFQRDLHGVAEIAAAVHLAATRAPASALLAEHVAEDVAKRLGKAAAKPFCPTPGAAHVGVYPAWPYWS